MIQEQSKASFKKLIKAMHRFDQKEATKLISQMATNELSKVDDEGKTALNHAIEYNYDKLCKLLLAKMSAKAINHVNGNGDTVLTHAASKITSTKVCKLLIPKMFNEAFNHINDDCTALMLAIKEGYEEIGELLMPNANSELKSFKS